jgi:hypothetical protein
MKNNCVEEIVLWEYIDDEMSPADKANLEQHFQDCEGCYKEYLELTSFDLSLIEAVKLTNNQEGRSSFEMEVNTSLIECPIKSYWLNGKKSLFWSVLTMISIFSAFGALTFVAVVMPHVGVSNLNMFSSILFKFVEFFLSSSALLGGIFMFLFVYNMFKSRIRIL